MFLFLLHHYKGSSCEERGLSFWYLSISLFGSFLEAVSSKLSLSQRLKHIQSWHEVYHHCDICLLDVKLVVVLEKSQLHGLVDSLNVSVNLGFDLRILVVVTRTVEHWPEHIICTGEPRGNLLLKNLGLEASLGLSCSLEIVDLNLGNLLDLQAAFLIFFLTLFSLVTRGGGPSSKPSSPPLQCLTTPCHSPHQSCSRPMIPTRNPSLDENVA